jgi:hypothetical protein
MPGRMVGREWMYGAERWTPEDAAKRATQLAQGAAKATPVAKPAPPVVDPRVAELRAKEAEITRLKSAVAKKEREDGMIRELRKRQAEVDQLSAEVDKRERRAKGFKGRIRFGGGFNAFGKHPQRPDGGGPKAA